MAPEGYAALTEAERDIGKIPPTSAYALCNSSEQHYFATPAKISRESRIPNGVRLAAQEMTNNSPTGASHAHVRGVWATHQSACNQAC